MYSIVWILQSILWIPGQIAIRLRFNYRVAGRENLKKIQDHKNGVLFVSNHRSLLDPVFVTAILPFFSPLRPMYFLSLQRHEYGHIPIGRYIFGGFLFKLFGAYPAYRGLKDYEKTLVHHIALLGDGRSVCMFPEGGITKDPEGRPQAARPGVAYLAKRTGAVVVPMAITGKETIEVRIGEPFVSKGETPEQFMEYINKLAGYVA